MLVFSSRYALLIAAVSSWPLGCGSRFSQAEEGTGADAAGPQMEAPNDAPEAGVGPEKTPIVLPPEAAEHGQIGGIGVPQPGACADGDGPNAGSGGQGPDVEDPIAGDPITDDAVQTSMDEDPSSISDPENSEATDEVPPAGPDEPEVSDPDDDPEASDSDSDELEPSPDATAPDESSAPIPTSPSATGPGAMDPPDSMTDDPPPDEPEPDPEQDEPIGGCEQQLLADAGFELASAAWQWSSTWPGSEPIVEVSDPALKETGVEPYAGDFLAWLGGIPDNRWDSHLVHLEQSVQIPTEASQITFSGMFRIHTEEDEPGVAYDALYVDLVRGEDEVLWLPQFWTNLDATDEWTHFSAQTTAENLAGQHISFKMHSETDPSKRTSFWFDSLRLVAGCGR